MIQCTTSQELQKNAHHNIQYIFFKLLVLSDQQFNQFKLQKFSLQLCKTEKQQIITVEELEHVIMAFVWHCLKKKY